MKYSQLYLVLIVTVGVIGFVVADGVPVTHQFAGGNSASATDVNENFQELADRIADNPTSMIYDYRDYIAANTVTSKTFAMTGATCDTEVRTYSRTPSGADTIIEVNRVRTENNAPCQDRNFVFLATPTEFKLVSIDFENGDNTDFGDGSVWRNSNMRFGVPITSDAIFVTTLNGLPADPPDVRLEIFTALGLEDVTVPAGTFQNCLKIRNIRNGVTHDRISWFCPGMGEVRRVQGRATSATMWELTAVTP